jgi:hypothetical protein
MTGRTIPVNIGPDSAFDVGERLAVHIILSHILHMQAAFMAERGMSRQELLGPMKQIISTTLESVHLEIRTAEGGTDSIFFEEELRRSALLYVEKVFGSIDV